MRSTRTAWAARLTARQLRAAWAAEGLELRGTRLLPRHRARGRAPALRGQEAAFSGKVRPRPSCGTLWADAQTCSRSLLDVEQLQFRTDAAGAVASVRGRGGEAPEIEVTAHTNGVQARGVGPGGGMLVYDIALSPLHHGLPAEAAQLRYWLAACLLLAACALCCVPLGGDFGTHPGQRYLAQRRNRL